MPHEPQHTGSLGTGSVPVEPARSRRDPLGLGSAGSPMPPWFKPVAQRYPGQKNLKRPATHHSCARWGNLVPNAYIDRVFLEESLVDTNPDPNILDVLQTPKITIDIKLVDHLNTDGTYSLLGDALNQQQQGSSQPIDLKQYFMIRCVMAPSTNAGATFEDALVNYTGTQINNLLGAVEATPGFLHSAHKTLNDITTTYVNSDGDHELIASYTFENLGINTLEHVSVFAFVQLNTYQLAQDLNLNQTPWPSSIEMMMGRVEQELVIENSQVVSLLKGTAASGTTSTDAGHAHSYIDLDPEGTGETEYATHPQEPQIKHRHQIINGVVQSAQSNCWRADPADPESCQELYRQAPAQNGGNGVPLQLPGPAGVGPHIHQLETTWIPINNVQDFRIRDEIKIDLSELAALTAEQLKFPDQRDFLTQFASKNSYLSELFVTKDANRNSRFFFAFDHGKYCLENSKYAHMISVLPDAMKQSVIATSPITRFQLTRRQVREEPAVNSLGAPVKNYLLDNGHSTIETPVIYSLADPHLTEINLILEDQPASTIIPRQRYFTGIDFDRFDIHGNLKYQGMSSKSDGICQYSINVEMIDGFLTIMKFLSQSLGDLIADYQKYISLTEIPGVYDARSRKFTATQGVGVYFNEHRHPATGFALSGQELLSTWTTVGPTPNLYLQGLIDGYIYLLGFFIDLTGTITSPSGFIFTKANYYAQKILTLTAPETGTVDGVLLFNELLHLLSSQINNTIKVGHSGGGIEDTLDNPPSNRDSLFKQQTMELKEYFNNTIGARFINESFVDNIGQQALQPIAIPGLSVYTQNQLVNSSQIEVNLNPFTPQSITEIFGNLGITYSVMPITQGFTSVPSYGPASGYLGAGTTSNEDRLIDILGPKDLADAELPDVPAEVFANFIPQILATGRELTPDQLQIEVDVLTGFVQIGGDPMMRSARFETKTLGTLTPVSTSPNSYYLCRQTKRSDVEIINSYFLLVPSITYVTTEPEPAAAEPEPAWEGPMVATGGY